MRTPEEQSEVDGLRENYGRTCIDLVELQRKEKFRRGKIQNIITNLKSAPNTEPDEAKKLRGNFINRLNELL